MPRQRVMALVLVALAIVAGLVLLLRQQSTVKSIHALRYGHGPYPAHLVHRNKTKSDGDIDFCWMFYLVTIDDRQMLIDTGVGDPTAVRTYRIRDYLAPDELVRQAGFAPEDIDDVVITHAHADHIGGLDLFPKARVILQADARAALAQKGGRLLEMVNQAEGEGRLLLLEGDHELSPNVELVASGGHTRGSQAVIVTDPTSRYVFVGDECYLDADCRNASPLPDGSVVDAERNLAFLEQLRGWIDEGATPLTFHDPHPSWAPTPCFSGNRVIEVHHD